MLGRRSFLGMFGAAPAAAALTFLPPAGVDVARMPRARYSGKVEHPGAFTAIAEGVFAYGVT